ncbi:MAG: hypothetical protein ACXVZV_01450 [Terriglobales bacterium]
MKTAFLVIRWICALLGWCLFFFWWKKASTPGWVSPTAVFYSLLSIAIVVSAAIAYSSLWILHNKRLARRGKRGSVSFYKPPRFEADALGRRLTLPPMTHDSYDAILVVRQVGNQKEYLPEDKVKGHGANA